MRSVAERARESDTEAQLECFGQSK